jgi:hypothetical protein
MDVAKFTMRARAAVALLTPAGWTIAGGVLIVIVAVLLWLVTAPARHRQAAAEAHAGVVVAQGQARAASDAVGVVSKAGEREAQIDQTTRENHDAIVSAPGAEAPVDPGVGDAGRRAVCMRRSAHSDPACQRLLHAGP